MDENTFKIGVNPEAAAVPQTTQPLNTPTPEAPQAATASATPPPAPPASSAPQPTSPVINTKLNVQLDKSVDTQLGRLGGAESKLLSAKSYLIIGIAILVLAATAYGAYIFFFAAESATEENFEDITLTNKLGGAEDPAETTESPATTPPSLTINLSEEETPAALTDAASTETLDSIDMTDTKNSATTDSETNDPKVPR